MWLHHCITKMTPLMGNYGRSQTLKIQMSFHAMCETTWVNHDNSQKQKHSKSHEMYCYFILFESFVQLAFHLFSAHFPPSCDKEILKWWNSLTNIYETLRHRAMFETAIPTCWQSPLTDLLEEWRNPNWISIGTCWTVQAKIIRTTKSTKHICLKLS